MMISKKVTQKNYANTAKEKVVIAQQMRQKMNNLTSLERKRKRSITNINKVFCSDAGEKDKLAKNDQ